MRKMIANLDIIYYSFFYVIKCIPGSITESFPNMIDLLLINFLKLLVQLKFYSEQNGLGYKYSV